MFLINLCPQNMLFCCYFPEINFNLILLFKNNVASSSILFWLIDKLYKFLNLNA